MIFIDEKDFEAMVSRAIDSLPGQYIDNMKNVAIIVEDEPSQAQRQQMHLVNGVTLFGLYEGIPLTNRGGNYSLVLPDKITIFKNPILASCNNLEELKSQIKRTVWHEIAHHYGLDHEDMQKILEKKQEKTN